MKIVKRESLYIRRDALPKDVRRELIDEYKLRFYNEKACANCEWMPDRHCDICDTCGGFKGGADLSVVKTVGANRYVTFPRGDLENLLAKLRSHKVIGHNEEPRIVEKHPDTDFYKPFEFTGKLRDKEQRNAARAIFDKKVGVLSFPVRGGKTVISTYCITQIGKKAIVIAGQKDWLDNFYETFCGSDTEQAFTTARGSGRIGPERNAARRKFKATGKRYHVGFCNKYEDFLMNDICLVTEQTFRTEGGQKLLEKIKDLFTVLVCDEIQDGSAPLYTLLLSKWNVEYCIGLTGTPDRKDGKFLVMEKLIGPIIFQGKVKRERPQLRTVQTAYTDNRDMSAWTSINTRLDGDKKRQKLIAEYVLKDVKNGHMIFIPMQRVKHMESLVNLINKMAGERIAAPFHGQVPKDKRKKTIDRARNYKIKVLVGSLKLLSVGINVPRASCLYEVTPSNNLPKAEQRFGRILTEFEDKPTPLIRVFMDHMKVRRRCFASEFWGVLKKKFNPIISDKEMHILSGWMNNRVNVKIDL